MAQLRSFHATDGTKATFMSQIALPNGDLVPIIDNSVVDTIHEAAPPDQRYVIEALGSLVHDLRKDGSVGHVMKLGIVDPEKYSVYTRIDMPRFKYDLLLEIHWKIIQCMRFSVPSMITDAIPTIEKLLSRSMKKPFARALGFYGTVAYTHVEGKEDLALNLYRTTTKQMMEDGSVAPILTFLWVKANIARMARRIDDIELAEEEEAYVRSWILHNPWIISPNDICQLISDDLGTGANILDHPDVLSLFTHLRQLATTGNYTPMMQPKNSNLDLVIVDDQTRTMSYDVEIFPPDTRVRLL